MLALNNDSSFKLSEDIMLQALPELDHYYAFNCQDGNSFKLNHTAYWVLDKFAYGIKLGDVLSRFREEFDIDINTAKKDLIDTIEYALENKIIREVKT